MLLSGILISIRFLLADSVDDAYIHKTNQAMARKLFLLMWMFLSFIINVAYTSVLLTTLVSTEYEKPIDTVQDLIRTDKPIYTHTVAAVMLNTDPRGSVQKFAKKVIPKGFDAAGLIPKEQQIR